METTALRAEVEEAVNIRVRVTTPQSERFLEHLGSHVRVIECRCLGYRILEVQRIDVGASSFENVSRPGCLDNVADLAAKVRDVRLNGAACALRWIISVHALDERIC